MSSARRSARACIGLLLTILPSRIQADDRVKLNLILDGRFITPPETPGFLDEGLGKTRYGHEPRAVQAKLAQAAVLGRLEIRPDLTLRIHASVDAEHDFGRRLDLVEAFVQYAPALGDTVSLDIRAGVFFPPVSLENTDPAWLSPYSVSFSAINSWIGEEVRSLGLEGGPNLRFGETEARFFASLNQGNDPSGTLLAWRGFALHDRLTGVGDRLPLPGLRSFDHPNLFPDQPLHVQPVREVDERWTWSSGLSVTNSTYRLKVLYQPGTANPASFDGAQYAWRTGYWSVGASRVFGPLEFLAQGLDGETRMGLNKANRNAVAAKFQAAYLLASWTNPGTSRHRITGRLDVFRVTDRDDFTTEDPNDESGSAWTLAYVFTPTARHRITAELLRVGSSRTNRLDLGRDSRATEVQGTLSWRLTF